MKRPSSMIWVMLMTAATIMVLSGCAGAAEATRPDEITANQAIGESFSCTPEKLAGDLAPFTVDWSDGQRAALEGAMNRGVAVVKLTCEGPEILKACQVVGGYDYSGVSPKTKSVIMKDRAKAAANFGGFLGTSLDALISQGRTLNLAYMIVGLRSTTVAFVEPAQLRGRCEGATHFVFEAQLGAFALETTEEGEAMTEMEILGLGGARADASSSKSARTTDGDPEACTNATSSDPDPTDGCSALMRVDLMALSAPGAAPSGAVEVGTREALGCPDGFVYADGECERLDAVKYSLCDNGDRAGCITQCQKGSIESCDRLASLELSAYFKIYREHDDADGELAKIFPINKRLNEFAEARQRDKASYSKACEDNLAAACSMAGLLNYHEQLPPRTSSDVGELPEEVSEEVSEEDLRKGGELGSRGHVFVDAMKGCRLGEQLGCMILQDNLTVHISPDEFAASVETSCAAGNTAACAWAASGSIYGYEADYVNNQYSPGYWTPDFVRATRFAQRACAGGASEACGVAAALYGDTQGPCKDLLLGSGLTNGRFELDREAIIFMCNSHNKNTPLTDNRKAYEMLTVGCEAGRQSLCEARAKHYGQFDASIWLEE